MLQTSRCSLSVQPNDYRHSTVQLCIQLAVTMVLASLLLVKTVHHDASGNAMFNWNISLQCFWQHHFVSTIFHLPFCIHHFLSSIFYPPFCTDYLAGKWVVADIALPILTTLTLAGNLELDYEKDPATNDYREFTLQVDHLIIMGGRLVVGWLDNRFVVNIKWD